MNLIHLPSIIFTIGYIAIGFVVVCLIVLAILKLRNRNLR